MLLQVVDLLAEKLKYEGKYLYLSVKWKIDID